MIDGPDVKGERCWRRGGLIPASGIRGAVVD